MKGYYGVAVYRPKNKQNYGSLLRSLNLMDGDFFHLIGARFQRQSSDTICSHRHIPVYEHATFEDFYKVLPYGCQLVGVELDAQAIDLTKFKHPERCVYLLGAEDHGLAPEVIARCHKLVKLYGRFSMNLAVAGSIVMHHRLEQQGLI